MFFRSYFPQSYVRHGVLWPFKWNIQFNSRHTLHSRSDFHISEEIVKFFKDVVGKSRNRKCTSESVEK